MKKKEYGKKKRPKKLFDRELEEGETNAVITNVISRTRYQVLLENGTSTIAVVSCCKKTLEEGDRLIVCLRDFDSEKVDIMYMYKDIPDSP